MIMIYLYDLMFVLAFLAFKQFMKWTQDTNLSLFVKIRSSGFWFEYSLILVAIFFAPTHSASESGVSFAMCILTKIIVDTITPENYRP